MLLNVANQRSLLCEVIIEIVCESTLFKDFWFFIRRFVIKNSLGHRLKEYSMIPSSTSLELPVLQFFELLIHHLKFFLFFLDYRIFFASFFLFLGSYFIEQIKVFLLNPCLLVNFAHFFMHDNIFRPFGDIFLVKHLEFIDVGNREIFGL
jgi:hypothetical protein